MQPQSPALGQCPTLQTVVNRNIPFTNMKEPDPAVAAARLRKLSRARPTLAMILGSGFHHVVNEMAVETRVPYHRLPGFPPVGVSGHTGELLLGQLGGTPLVVLSGRAHFY